MVLSLILSLLLKPAAVPKMASPTRDRRDDTPAGRRGQQPRSGAVTAATKYSSKKAPLSPEIKGCAATPEPGTRFDGAG
jgi:hypothetical protein